MGAAHLVKIPSVLADCPQALVASARKSGRLPTANELTRHSTGWRLTSESYGTIVGRDSQATVSLAAERRTAEPWRKPTRPMPGLLDTHRCAALVRGLPRCPPARRAQPRDSSGHDRNSRQAVPARRPGSAAAWPRRDQPRPRQHRRSNPSAGRRRVRRQCRSHRRGLGDDGGGPSARNGTPPHSWRSPTRERVLA